MNEAIREIVEVVDSEWLELIMAARNMGLTIDEVRNFLQQAHLNSYISDADGLQNLIHRAQ
ncbi:anti-repressor SinI family protein [Paenibacillus cremeus]|uniref:DNA-binding anti-repressor SinI n=1 Tax=Paenibacillus cremeus TaxID=2163881 RepID=A0A559K0H5_9BACL|nr:anti-repressor SinI family protein [Paenibacillus cremeus]TVY05655.1 DNA-binding anti-repressor SinI [Paenibacillus cremeus]